MTNWLERARHEISQRTTKDTAIAAKRNLSSVMAVPQPDKHGIVRDSIGSNDSTTTACMTVAEEHTIRSWLAHIGENDAAIISEILDQCKTDSNARQNLILWIKGTTPKLGRLEEERRYCNQCANLTKHGLCLAAKRGEIAASRIYRPIPDLL